MFVPAWIDPVGPVLVSARSAWGVTDVLAVAVLLALLGSVVVAATVAELLTVAPAAVLAFTFTTRVTVALPPVASVPMFAVTVPPAWLTAPWLAVPETKVVL